MKKENRFQTGNVVLISLAHLVHDVYTSFLATLLPLLIEKFSMSYTMAGLLTVIQRLPSLLNPFIGIVADKINLQIFIVIAPTIAATTMSLIGAAPSYYSLLFLLLITGFGVSLFHVPAPVLIKSVSGNRVGKGMSYFMLGGELARSLGPIIILYAVDFWGMEGTYRLIPIGIILSTVLYLRFRKTVPLQTARVKENGKIRASLKEYTNVFIGLSGIIFFNSMIKGALTTFLPTFMTAEGSSLWAGGISLSILQLAGAAGTFLSGTISDKMGRKQVLLIVSVVNPLMMLGFIYAPEFLKIPLLILNGISLFASTPVLMAVVNEMSNKNVSFFNGMFMTVNFMFSALAIITVGFIGDLIGLFVTYNITAFISFLAIPFVFIIFKKKNI